ncbi:hypothetical protein RD792_003583, partial [Penstemon davidsonii]
DETCRSMHDGKGCCKHNINLDDNDLDVTIEICEEELKKSFDPDNSGIKEELISQLMFESIDEAEKFYIAYAKAEGFDVRRRSVQVKGEIVKNRVWVCTQSGFREPVKEGDCRKREPKPLTRCGCKATFRVSHDQFSKKYFVSKFENKHNHPLHVCLKRYMSPADKTMLSMMTTTGFKPSQVMYYLEQLSGGAGKLSFRRKDGYNWLNKLRAERIREGDMNTVISNFKNLKLLDERLFFYYTLDDESALTKLFWCDGASRAEYEAFGDVLVFDSTYKTNTFLYLLVIFSGVNRHCSTCIFGAAFLQNETIDSYQWVLQTFLEAMDGRIPEGVLTDQDAAMRSTIMSEFSEELELSWANLVEKHNLFNPSWVVDMYKKRESKPGHKSTTCLENPSTVVRHKKSSAKNPSGMEEKSTPEATTCTKKTSTAAWQKKSSAKKSSGLKEKSTPLHNADQNLGTPAQQSVQHGNIINNFQHVAQLPVVFNTHPNNNGYPLYSHAPYPFNPFCFQQTQLLPPDLMRPLGSGEVMGPNTTLLWQQQSVSG